MHAKVGDLMHRLSLLRLARASMEAMLPTPPLPREAEAEDPRERQRLPTP